MEAHICKLVLIVILIFWEMAVISTKSEDKKKRPPGHLEKLGSHRDPLGITMIGKFSTPAVFYGHFVKPGKPLWMRSALESAEHPGLTNWTDEFLKKHHGIETVKIEPNKKENRSSNPRWLTLSQFLSLYKTEDMYMVQTLRDKMEDLVLIPSSLQCGGFQKAIQDAVMWFGSGKTMSVLHYEDLDNLLCLLDGQKDFVLIDKVYKQEVEADGFHENEGYSDVNVAKVDLHKFPRLSSVPWHEVHLEKGDCIFIPKGWYHQVNSSKRRHLAINIWFSHLYWFNSENCSISQDFHQPLEPVSTFGFASPNEIYRSKLLEKVHDKGILLEHVFVSALDTVTEERSKLFFEAIDRHRDHVLSWSDLYDFDIDRAIVTFPDIFGLPGYSPGSVQGEKVVLYKPLLVFDDNVYDSVDENFERREGKILGEAATNEVKKERAGPSDDSLDSGLDLASLPLPDDPVVVDVSHKDPEWAHHDLYKGDVGQSEGNEETHHHHTGSHVYTYTESGEESSHLQKDTGIESESNEKDAQSYKSENKDEL